MNKDLEKEQLASENEQLKKQIAELSKFKHERKGTSKKKTLDQISTPAHISEFMRDLVQESKKNHSLSMVIDISCGAGSLLIPWKDTEALLIGADIDEEALELCKQNLLNAILFKHNSLECPTPCEIKEHLFYEGTKLEKIKEYEEKIFVLNPPFGLAQKMVSKALTLAKVEMNKIIAILPNSFETKRDFKELRESVLTNYCVENIITLSNYAFQPYVVVGTIILQLTTKKPPEHFWKFKAKNDGYTQSRRRERKEGENDFDIFWKFKDKSEKEKSKIGFQKLEIERIKQQKDWEFNLPPDFSYLFRKPTPEELAKRIEEEEKLDLAILENWEKLKEGMEKRVKEIKEKWVIGKNLQEFENQETPQLVSVGELVEKVEIKNNINAPVWSVTKTRGFVRSEDNFQNKVFSDDTSNYKLVLPQHFAYNPARANIGSINYNESQKSGCVSPLYLVFKVKDQKVINPQYLFCLFQSEQFKEQVKKLCFGSVRQNLTWNSFGKIKIPLLSLAGQASIIQQLSEIEAKIKVSQEILLSLNSRKCFFNSYREKKQFFKIENFTNGNQNQAD